MPRDFTADALRALVAQFLAKPDLRNSFENWHVRGLDYLCLLRTPQLTLKLYRFGDVRVNSLGATVWPHTHRYSFWSLTLAGRVEQWEYERDNASAKAWSVVPCFPMRQERARAASYGLSAPRVNTSSLWAMSPEDCHTIKAEPGSLALQAQFADEIPDDNASLMFVPRGTRHGCDALNLYRRMQPAVAAGIVAQARAALDTFPASPATALSVEKDGSRG